MDGGTFVGLHTHSHGATWVHHLDLDGAITSMRLYTSVMDLDGANFNEAVHLCNGARFHLQNYKDFTVIDSNILLVLY